MSTPSDLAYERATSHIRSTVRNTLVNDFNTAGAWRDADLAAFLKRAVPITQGGQRATSQVTATYLRSLLGQPIPWNPTDLISDGIRGIPPAEIYTRPYHEVWSRLGEGMPLPEAVNLGANRLSSLVNTDMQLAKVRTSEQMLTNADGVYGYRRILNGPHPCDYCRRASTQAYHNGNLMPIHSNCSCSVMPITDPLEMAGMTNATTLGKSGPIASPSSELGQAFTGPPPKIAADPGDVWPASPSGEEMLRATSQVSGAPAARALKSYTKAGYINTNGYLRGTKDIATEGWLPDIFFEIKEQINSLTAAIAKAAATKSDMVLWRGVAADAFDPASLIPGTLIRDQGFLSMSSFEEVARSTFGAGEGALHMQIFVPKGTKAVVGSINEMEVIGQRGSSLRYVGSFLSDEGRKTYRFVLEQG